MLDLTKSYRVEQKPVLGDNIGLDKEGLARHVGTIKSFCVAYNDRTGKYETGLDPHSPKVLALPKEEYETKLKWIEVTKKSLEEKIGRPGILEATNSDFWDLWTVDIEIGQDKKVKVMGSHPQFQPDLYWQHALALITLDANDSIPRSKRESSDPKYKGAQFYLTTPQEENEVTSSRVKKNRQRNVEMNNLFGEGGRGFERAFNIAFLLGIQKESNIGIEKLEEVLEIFTPQPEYLDKFLALCKASDEDIALDVTIKKAIDYDIIKFNAVDKLYYRGGANFRSTQSATTDYFRVNMAEATIAREFMEIKEAVSKRDNKQKKK